MIIGISGKISSGKDTIGKIIQYLTIQIKKHLSETALDNYSFDYTIDNNGTIEELIIKVKEILIKEKLINK